MNRKRLLRRILWIFGGVVGLLVILVAALWVVIHTRAFANYARKKAVAYAEAKTGSRVEIRRLGFHWNRLGVDAYGITIAGNSSVGAPLGKPAAPFFTAQHLGASLRILSLWRREFNLSQLVLDRPVVHFREDAQGRTNLPRPPPSNSKTSTLATLFRLKIAEFELHSGEVYYNDQKIPVSAELFGVRSQIAFDRLRSEYAGTIAYARGRIAAKQYAPIEHSARLHFELRPNELAVNPVSLAAGRSRLTLFARISDFADGGSGTRMTGGFQAVLFTSDLSRILNSPSLPAGELATRGELAYECPARRASPGAVDCVTLSGTLDSPELLLPVKGSSIPADSLHASYRIERGELEVPRLDATVFSGHLTASARGFPFAETGNTKSSRSRAQSVASSGWRVSASLNNAALSGIQQALIGGTAGPGAATAKIIRLSGTASVKLDAEWSRMANLRAQARVAISGSARLPRTASRNGRQTSAGAFRSNLLALPLIAAADARYDAGRRSLSLGESTAQVGATKLSASGTLGKRSNLLVQANAANLAELMEIASSLRAVTSASSSFSVENLRLAGSAQFAGNVSGSLKNPILQGELTSRNSQAENFAWQMLTARVSLSPPSAAIEDGAIRAGHGMQAGFSGRVQLDHWRIEPSSAISACFSLNNLNLADADRLAHRNDPVIGTLSGHFALSGTKSNPAVQGSATIANASAWGQPIPRATLTVQSSGPVLNTNAQVQTPAGQIAADASYSRQSKTFHAAVNAPGIRIQQLHPVRKAGVPLAGTVQAKVTGGGTPQSPRISAEMRIPQLRFRGQPVANLVATLTLVQRSADFTFAAGVQSGTIRSSERVELAGDYPANATLDVRALPLGPLVAGYFAAKPDAGAQPSSTRKMLKPGELQGQLEFHAQASGPLRKPAEMQAHIEVAKFEAGAQNVRVALARPLLADYRAGVLAVQPAEVKGPGTDLTFSGSAPIRAAGVPTLAARGTVDLSVIHNFQPSITSSGRLEIDIAARGNPSSLRSAAQGEIRVVNAALSSPGIPIYVQNLNGTIHVAGNRIETSDLAAAAGGGRLSMQGSLVYGAPMAFNFALQAKSVRVRYPEGLRSVLDADLQMNGTRKASSLTGRVLVDRLSFTPQFDLSSLTAQLAGGTAGPAPSAFEQNMKLNLALQSSNQLNLASSKLSMAGAANLTITGTLAVPVVLGRVSLSNGEIFFMGKRFEVQSGTIAFSNPVRTEPVLNLYVGTTVEQYQITLNFLGPVDRMRTTYASVPPLSPADIINLLAFGKTAAESASTASAPASVGAESVVAQGAASQVSSKLANLTGLSQLTLNPLAGSNQSDPGAQIAIQKRVTGSLLVTFSTDVNSTQATAVQVQYNASPRMTISILRDQNGGYALDIRLRKTF